MNVEIYSVAFHLPFKNIAHMEVVIIIINIDQNISNGLNCPCPKTGCSNHGNCDKCKSYHSSSKSLPFCQREHGFFTKIFYRKNFEMVQLLKSEGKI